jgi:signal recognition particle receptor subunit beta
VLHGYSHILYLWVGMGVIFRACTVQLFLRLSGGPSPLLRTIMNQVLENVAPFLPPPLIVFIERMESGISLNYEPIYVVSIIVAAIILYLIISSLRSKSSHKRNRLIVDHDADFEESVLSSEMEVSKYGDSVILIGPSQSGKTYLFHQLMSAFVSGEKDPLRLVPSSVISLRANIEVVQSNQDSDKSKGFGIRLVDYPGHVQLQNQLAPLLQPGNTPYTTRVLLVIDSTKAIHEAAKLIYQSLFLDPNLLQAWQRRHLSDEKSVLQILVVCNKSEEKDAKNWRRIKLQLKAELENLHKIKHLDDARLENQPIPGKSRTVASLLDETINLDELGIDIPFEFNFISISGSSSDDPSFKALMAFVMKGEVAEKNVPLIKLKK